MELNTTGFYNTISKVDRNLKIVTTDYTITNDDVLNGRIIICNNSADMTLTLPAASDFETNTIHYLDIRHPSHWYNVKIEQPWTDTFVYGNTYFNLGTKAFWFKLGIANLGGSASYGLLDSITVKASWHRDASWASSNFSSMTVIPFDTEEYNTQDEILVYTSWASARYTAKTAWSYKISFQIDIDSTGWSTWNATAWVYKNGSALDILQARTGNYGNEDQSMSCVSWYVDLETDDYIDLRIDQNNLTGNLIHAMLNVESVLWLKN